MLGLEMCQRKSAGSRLLLSSTPARKPWPRNTFSCCGISYGMPHTSWRLTASPHFSVLGCNTFTMSMGLGLMNYQTGYFTWTEKVIVTLSVKSAWKSFINDAWYFHELAPNAAVIRVTVSEIWKAIMEVCPAQAECLLLPFGHHTAQSKYLKLELGLPAMHT